MRIDIYLHQDPELLETLRALQRQVTHQGAEIMALSAAVQAKIDEIKAALDAAVAGITSDIQELKDKITAGGASEAEILAGLDSISASAQAVTDLDLANPVPPTP